MLDSHQKYMVGCCYSTTHYKMNFSSINNGKNYLHTKIFWTTKYTIGNWKITLKAIWSPCLSYLIIGCKHGSRSQPKHNRCLIFELLCHISSIKSLDELIWQQE
jgi:hypothetical protein